MGETTDAGGEVCRSADDVKACLSLRWPDAEYLSIYEAPQDSSRSGRKLDVVVLSLWQSRGLALDGVEVKVSASDWTRELKQAEKADWWWGHVNRFWVAVPEALAERVVGEAPEPWGVLACTPGEKPRVAKKAPHHEAIPLPWTACVGMMRAAADCGVNALYRAEAKGREQGRQDGRREAERKAGDGYLSQRLQQVQASVQRFEEASGVRLDQWPNTPKAVGSALRAVLQLRDTPDYLTDSARRYADQLEAAARKAREAADATAKAVRDLNASEAA